MNVAVLKWRGFENGRFLVWIIDIISRLLTEDCAWLIGKSCKTPSAGSIGLPVDGGNLETAIKNVYFCLL